MAELVRAWNRTITGSSMLLVAVDDDDDELQGYQELASEVWVQVGPRWRVAPTLNYLAKRYASDHFALGFMGDDHRPRTKGWDQRFVEALREMGSGLVYGDDLFQGENLPTAVAMTSDIVRALGYMVPPALTHMYMDNFWLGLGRALERIRYLPDVVIEHMHPVAGKAEWDEGYRQANAQSMYDADRAQLEWWLEHEEPAALTRVKAAICHGEWRLFPEGTTPKFTTPWFFAHHSWVPLGIQPGHAARTAMMVDLLKLVEVEGLTLSDFGCGDGAFLEAIPGDWALESLWGYDVGLDNVKHAQANGLPVSRADFLRDEVEYGDILVLNEVLEHLVDPHGFLRQAQGKYLLASSPSSETADWHYEDHAWAWNMEGFQRMVEGAGWTVLEHREVEGGTNHHGGVAGPQCFQGLLAKR